MSLLFKISAALLVTLFGSTISFCISYKV